MATRAETNVVYAAGLVQGIVLVTFPAASTIFTDPDAYGLLLLAIACLGAGFGLRSEEHTSELQSRLLISYAVFCLKKKNRKSTRLNSSHVSLSRMPSSA